jgi:hypothetical protein
VGNVIAVIAIIFSVISLGLQLFASWKQSRDSRHANEVAAAFFDLYASWALNRRAQIPPVNDEQLRQSSAGFYTAAFRLSALLEDEAFSALQEFMEGALDTKDETTWQTMYALYKTATTSLKYRKEVASEPVLKEMFWHVGQNYPQLNIGKIAPSNVSAPGALPTPPTPTGAIRQQT